MPLFFAPFLCLAAALVFGAEARSSSAVAERLALRCVDRFALLSVVPACAVGLILDAPWSLLGVVDDLGVAFGCGLAASALLGFGVASVARVASQSNLSQGSLRALGGASFAASGLFVIAIGVSKGTRALVPGGALAAFTVAFVVALVALSMILSLQAAAELRPGE